jgi:hypothetical protein
LANSTWKKLQHATMSKAPTLKLLRQRMNKH